MKNIITFTSANTATASKSFLKKAMNYGSDEYYFLKKFRSENPDVKISARAIKKNPNKDSYKDLTYNNMIAYINTQSNRIELLAEFERQKQMSVIAKNRYRYILNWFRSACFENESEFVEFRNSIAHIQTAQAVELVA